MFQIEIFLKKKKKKTLKHCKHFFWYAYKNNLSLLKNNQKKNPPKFYPNMNIGLFCSFIDKMRYFFYLNVCDFLDPKSIFGLCPTVFESIIFTFDGLKR